MYISVLFMRRFSQIWALGERVYSSQVVGCHPKRCGCMLCVTQFVLEGTPWTTVHLNYVVSTMLINLTEGPGNQRCPCPSYGNQN